MNTPLTTIELNPVGQPKASVIWMHGLGADANDFVPVVPELRLPDSLTIRYVFPNAPKQAVTINGGAVMQAWYDITGNDLARRTDENGVRASQALIGQLIEREHALGVPYERIFLAGFSQGGVIALQTGLRYPKKLGGILALSTYLACVETLASEGTAANKATKILMVHGTGDQVIALDRAEKSRELLQQNGYAVQWQTYPMQHSVCAEEIGLISRFFKAQLV
jgi:phospholipase/carboxylesterase